MSSNPGKSHKIAALMSVFQNQAAANKAQETQPSGDAKKTNPVGAPKKAAPKKSPAVLPQAGTAKPTGKQTSAAPGGFAKTGPRVAPISSSPAVTQPAAKPTASQPSSSAPIAKPQEQPKPAQQAAAQAPVQEEITYSTFAEDASPVASTAPASSQASGASDADAVYSEFADPTPAIATTGSQDKPKTVDASPANNSADDGAFYSEFSDPAPAKPSADISATTAAAVLAHIAPIEQDLGQPSYEGVPAEEAVYSEFAPSTHHEATDAQNGYSEDMDLGDEAVASPAFQVSLTTSTAYIDDASGYLDGTEEGIEYIAAGGYEEDAVSIGSDGGSGYTDDAYGVLDLSEATLNSGAYLVESDVSESSSEPSTTDNNEAAAKIPEPSKAFGGFASAYLDLDIDDPAVEFVLKERSEFDDDEEEEEPEDLSETSSETGSENKSRIRGSLGLLRRSSSTTSLHRLRRTGSLRALGASDEIDLTTSSSSAISSATSSGYASFDSEAQKGAVYGATSSNSGASSSSGISPRSHGLAGPATRPGAHSNAPQGNTEEYFAAAAGADAYTTPIGTNLGVGKRAGSGTLSPRPSGGLNLSGGSSSSAGRRDIHQSGGSTGSDRRGNLPHPSKLTNAQMIQEVLDSKETWNDRFQVIYDAPESESKYDALHRLSVDFLGVAETYGKVIISELSLPDSEKSIPPINIGGVAGGSKYAVRGLLFKFAVDVPPHFLYGSDEYAQKAAGHELKGLNHWSLNSEGLHFPLMALVRYCGFTLVALSMLPIGGNVNGKDSLVYGSDDAGRTVHFDDDVIYEKMKQTAMALNLKGHYLVADTSRLMYGPGDIEGHLGTDGLHYALDYARVYPPAALVQGEIKEKSRCLFRLLRPELVSRFTKPLSSDAFTAWGRMNSDIHNAEVREATQYLVDTAIPGLAKSFPTTASCGSWLQLRREFHLHGVNIRYMGLVRRVTISAGDYNPEFRESPHRWLLREMVVRVLKSTLNQKWRELIKKYQRITPDRCIQEAIGVINAAIEPQTTPQSKQFWGKTIRDMLSVKFPLALTDEEAALDLDENGALKSEPSINLQKLVFDSPTAWSFFFIRLSDLTGIVFNRQVPETGMVWPSFGVLTSGDVLEIRSAVKQMSLVDFAFVMAKSLNGLRQMSPALATRLFGLAIDRLRESPQISLVILRRVISLKAYIIRTLKRMKWADSLIKAVAEFVDVALDGAQLMCNNVPTDLAVDAAMFLHEIHATTNDDAKIISYLQRAIDVDPKNVRPYLEVAKIQVFANAPYLKPEGRLWIDRAMEIGSMDPLIRLQVGLLLLSVPGAVRYSMLASDAKDSFVQARSVKVKKRSAILDAREKLAELVEAEEAAAKASAEAKSEASTEEKTGESTESTESGDSSQPQTETPASTEKDPSLTSDERIALEKLAAQEPPTEEDCSDEWNFPSAEALGWKTLDEVIELWMPIKEQQPHLFAELDYHMFLPRADHLDVIEPWTYPLSATNRAASFLCLAFVASRVQCPQLDDAIRELMQAGVANDPTALASRTPLSLDIAPVAEFSTLLIILSLTFPFDGTLCSYLASLGPFNTVTRLIFHTRLEASPRFLATEAEFGRFLTAFPKLTSLHLPETVDFTGSILADLPNVSRFTTLDLIGTKCEGEDFEAFCELLTKDLVKPASHMEIVVQATAPPAPAEGETPEGEENAAPAPTTPQGPILSVYPSQVAMTTLLLPTTVSTDSAARALSMLSGIANIEHLAVGLISDELLSSIALFGASLQFLSLAKIQSVDHIYAEKVLKLLPNLLMIDCAGTQAFEAKLAPAFSRPRFHPTLEIFVTANELMHFFTTSKPRTVYFTTGPSPTGKGSVAMELASAEWPSMSLKKYCLPHHGIAFQASRYAANSTVKSMMMTLLTVERPFHSNQPLMMRARGRDLDSQSYSCKSLTHQNTTSWTVAGSTVAEIKTPTNFGNPPSVAFLYNGRLEHKTIPSNVGMGNRIKVDLPGAPSQVLTLQNFQRSAITFPPGMHINYAGMAYISLAKNTQ